MLFKILSYNNVYHLYLRTNNCPFVIPSLPAFQGAGWFVCPSCGKALTVECVLLSNYHQYQLTRVDTFSVRPCFRSLPSILNFPKVSPNLYISHFTLERKVFRFLSQPNSTLPFCLNMAYTPHPKISFPK